jgi:hypothetical protein
MAIHNVTPWDSHENAVSMEESIRIWRSTRQTVAEYAEYSG